MECSDYIDDAKFALEKAREKHGWKQRKRDEQEGEKIRKGGFAIAIDEGECYVDPGDAGKRYIWGGEGQGSEERELDDFTHQDLGRGKGETNGAQLDLFRGDEGDDDDPPGYKKQKKNAQSGERKRSDDSKSLMAFSAITMKNPNPRDWEKRIHFQAS